jgi:hypothetical protein
MNIFELTITKNTQKDKRLRVLVNLLAMDLWRWIGSGLGFDLLSALALQGWGVQTVCSCGFGELYRRVLTIH